MEEQVFNAILFVIATIFLYAIYWYGYGRFQFFKNMGIDGIKPQWFIGNMLNIQRDFNNPYESMHDLILKNNYKTMGVFLMGAPMYVVSDVKMLKEIMVTKFDNFRDRMVYHDRPYPQNLMLGWMIGKRWKTLRAKLAPSFTTNKIKSTMELLNRSGTTCVQLLTESINKKSGISLKGLGTGYSTESILSASFGLEAKNQTPMNKRIIKYGVDFFKGQGTLWVLMQWLPFSGLYMQYVPNPMLTCIKEIQKDVVGLLEERKKEKVKRNDFFQFMLSTQNEKNGMTDDEVFGSSANFMAAGQETAGNTLSCALFEATKQQDIQKKLFDEIKSIWSDKSEILTYEMVEQMKYVEMFIKEALRVYSPTPMTLRACKKYCEIDDVKFHPYSYIYIPIYTIHRSPVAYEKPYEFYPEHFTDEAVKNREDIYFIPFGFGPRICLGYKFAMLELKVAVARIIREFELKPAEGFPKELTMEQRLTNSVVDDIPCTITKRKD